MVINYDYQKILKIENIMSMKIIGNITDPI